MVGLVAVDNEVECVVGQGQVVVVFDFVHLNAQRLESGPSGGYVGRITFGGVGIRRQGTEAAEELPAAGAHIEE